MRCILAEWNWLPAWQQQDIEIKQKNLVNDGFYKVTALHLRHRCFSGEWSPWLVREQICRRDAAAVLLVDLQAKSLILVEQLRIGLIGTQKTSPWLLEIVAGLQEPGESAEATIRREALEEAHCRVGQVVKIGEFYNTPGGFAEKTTLFCAAVIERKDRHEGGIHEEHEDIRIHALPMQEVMTAWEQGAFISSASTVIALQWLRQKMSNQQLMSILKP